MLLFGQIMAYAVGHASPGIDTSEDGSSISYMLKTDRAMQYSEIHLDNGFQTPDRYYVLIDDAYAGMMDPSAVKPTYYFLQREVSKCASISIEAKTASEICTMMDESVMTGTFSIGLIVFTGALPDTMYNGTASCKIISWLNAGGTLCWSGSPFGKYISSTDSVHEVPDYSSAVNAALFGTEGLINDSPGQAFAQGRINPVLTELSGIYFADMSCAVNISKAAMPHMFLGYSDGTYAGVTLMKYGSGMIELFGGYTYMQDAAYMVHSLVLKLTYATELTDHKTEKTAVGGCSSHFADSPELTHAVVLHDVTWSCAWVYDRTEQKFI